MDLGLICRNYPKGYCLGKMILPVPFMLEYGSSMPNKLSFEVPSGEIWFGKYITGKQYVEGLENMMMFYGIRPYHMVVFRYLGGGEFKLQIFNECAVEICYPFSCPSLQNFRFKRNDPFGVVANLKLTTVEIDKLAATCSFNMLENFDGLHDIVIGKQHLTPQSCYEVMSVSEFDKFCKNGNMKSIKISLEHHAWKVALGFKNGKLTFDKGWYEFVKAAKICEGDICVLIRTAAEDKFKIAVLPNILIKQWSSTCDSRGGYQCFSWLKKLKGSCLDTGHLEVPRLFAMRFATELQRKITFKTSDGNVFHGNYNSAENEIYGLNTILSAYEVYHNCVILFEYVGVSTFNVSIFDSQNMDHLKEVTGEYIADIVRELQISQTEIANQDTLQVEDVAASSDIHSQSDNGESEEEHDEIQNEEMIVAGNYRDDFPDESNAFVATLKKSHLDKKGRGLYCRTCCFDFYKNWNAGTTITLNYIGRSFNVQVQRFQRSCRFRKGWDNFTTQCELKEEDQLEFRFTLEYNLDVRKIN